MKSRLLALLAVLFVSGCATVSHAPLSKDASASLQGKSLARTQYAAPNFTAFTAGSALFGILGAAAAIGEGNSIVKDNGIQDPARAIGQLVSTRLAAARTMRTVEPTKVSDSDKTAQDLARDHHGVEYLLDVGTFNWMFIYYPSDWTHYRVMYAARVRLIDVPSQSVVAQTVCQTIQGDDAKPPTKEQLLDAKAALLKEYLGKAATACADLVARDLLLL